MDRRDFIGAGIAGLTSAVGTYGASPAAGSGLAPEARASRGHGAAPQDGIALCLSGGGYRAMLFHLGSLWRLNECGYLPKLTRVSSVSGGSIAAGLLGVNWNSLEFGGDGVASKFQQLMADPLRAMAKQTIFDQHRILSEVVSLIKDIVHHDLVIDAYRKHLFGTKTLQDLPDEYAGPGNPRFVINATNLMTGSLWRFARPYMADWQVGKVMNPNIEIAVAVAASSAFPIGLPPVKLSFDPATMEDMENTTLHTSPYTEQAILVDGGVYDNMGIEDAWKECKTVLVSNAGGLSAPDPKPMFGGRDPIGIFSIIDNQVGDLRERQVNSSFDLPVGDRDFRHGAYWSIGTNIDRYALPPDKHLPCPYAKTLALAKVPTIIQKMDDNLQERLINWGYAVTDAAMRAYVEKNLPASIGFPYPQSGL